MFALLAFLCFFAALIDFDTDVPLVTLGLAFIALHLMVGGPFLFWRKQ